MKLYVGTYHKYNCGSIFGKWLDLDDFADATEFYEACCEVHKDEKDPELMFQDYESDYGWEDSLYCECAIPSDYWAIKAELQRTSVENDVFAAFVACTNERVSETLVDKCMNSFLGRFNSLEDYAMYYCEEAGFFDGVSQTFAYYFDYEKFARDLELSGDVFINDGCVFQS